MTTYERIYERVRQIPPGFVATYGDVARAAGTHARVVGNALHVNPDGSQIPCHRVVNAAGQLSGAFAFGGSNEQTARLRREGITVAANQVDLAQHRFIFE